jgi:S1-C subfamily serine protease
MHGANESTPTDIDQSRPRSSAVASAFALLTAFVAVARGADDLPPANALPAFQAGDISIGEPIALPFDSSAKAQPQAAAPAAGIQQPGVSPGPDVPRTASAVPGNGWLGLVVAESASPGRFAVAEVAAGGPAAASGILAGDEVRAIDGLPLRTSDEVAQALTAIAPGQKVRLAIGRGEQVADVMLEAIPRPPASRGWAAADAGQAPASQVAAVTQDVPPTMSVTVPAPPAAVPAPAAHASSLPAVAAPQPATAGGFPVAAWDSAASVLPPPAAGSQPVTPGPAPASGPGQLPAPERVSESQGAAVTASPSRAGPPTGDPRGRTALGVRTLPIDSDVQARFRLPEASGAYVIGVVGDLPASRAGVPAGSVIVSLDNRPVRSPAELTRLVTAGPVGRPMPLEYVLPGGTAQRAEVVLQTLERPLEEALVGAGEPTATDVPTLQPQPAGTIAQRPLTPLDEPTAAAVQAEIRQLRIRLESLERRLEAASR